MQALAVVKHRRTGLDPRLRRRHQATVSTATVRETAMETRVSQDAEFDFGHVEPAAVLVVPGDRFAGNGTTQCSRPANQPSSRETHDL